VAGPLDDVLVIDLTRALAGPHATMLLADLGARVIKIEQPGTGDESRHWGPPFAAPAPEAAATGARPVGTYFLSCNRNKESVTCDLRGAAGRELLTRLIRRADVLVENFRPGVLDRLGFPVARLHELNPRLVICSITGFGHDGPEGARPGYDQIVQGEAGLMSVTGPGPGQPMKAGLSVADVMSGANAALGIVAALHERASTGTGRVVRTSLLASMVAAHAFQGTRWTVAREVPAATGNHHPAISPYGAFRCGDGMIQVAVANEQQWQRFAPVVGIDPADERFARNELRVLRRDELTAEIERALAGASRAHWLPMLAEAGIPAGSIRGIDEVYEWAQTRSQGLVISVDHPVLGEIELPGPVLRFDGEPPREHAAPPLLGQHDAAVREWLDEAEEV
jgi:crotonobetainyl-CoA:carnitine CoA-transferase CaiB-like acyl-CoA transferase